MLREHHYDRLGALVATVGSQDFGSAFYSMFRDLLDIEDCTVFSFPTSEAPQSLIGEGDCDERTKIVRRLANDYVTSGFRDDPNVRSEPSRNAFVTNGLTLHDTPFGQHYYAEPAVAHELVTLGEAGGTLYYTSFYRCQRERQFSDSDVGAVSELSDFIAKTLHRHDELVSPEGDSCFNFVARPSDRPGELRERTLDYLREILVGSQYRLSAREAEVCAGIVMGYSTLAIGLNCSISPNTVATHRKRAYAKMGISSQNELFVLYFATVRDFQAKFAH